MRIVPLICAAVATLLSGCVAISTVANVSGLLLAATGNVSSSALSAGAAVVGTAENVSEKKAAEKLP